MSFRSCLFKRTGIVLPTSEPLWTKEEGLDSVVVSLQKQPPEPFVDKVVDKKLTAQDQRAFLYRTMVEKDNIRDLKGRVLVSDVDSHVFKITNKIFSNRAAYQSISGVFPNPIRWYHVAMIHQMEGSLDFNTYLGNGQRFNRKTTIVPKGRGPFRTFKEGAIDAIKYDKLNLVYDWGIGNTLFILEGFNGYGYTKYKGINSPYIWSGSNHYTAGYYVDDGVYDKNTVSQQIGIALIYKEILKRLSVNE